MGILLLAALLRILVFLQNRSLFIDEASLGAQIIDKSFTGLFGNFVDQFAPPVFCAVVKVATVVFGNTENALRLFPLICSVIGIVLFHQLCKTFLEPRHIIFPLLLFGFSIGLVQYSTEVKQYSTDATIALGMLLLGLKLKPDTIQTKGFLLWGLAGAFSIWVSMPVVFVLSGVGIYYGVSFIQKTEWQKLLTLSLVGMAWLASFGIYFFSIIQNDLGIEKLENYHSPFFMPLPPTSLEDLQKGGKIFLSFYRTSIGSTTIAISWGILSTVFGIYSIYKKEKLIGSLLVLPIISAIFASGLQLYSLIPRLTLFFIPILLLFVGIGTQKILASSPRLLQWLIVCLLAVIIFNQKSYSYFFQRFEIEELRPVLNYVHEHAAPEDLKYVHFQAENAYVFYSRFYKYKESCQLENAIIGLWSDRVSEFLIGRKEAKIWLIFSHFNQTEIDGILAAIKDQMIIKDSFQETGASCFLIEKAFVN